MCSLNYPTYESCQFCGYTCGIVTSKCTIKTSWRFLSGLQNCKPELIDRWIVGERTNPGMWYWYHTILCQYYVSIIIYPSRGLVTNVQYHVLRLFETDNNIFNSSWIYPSLPVTDCQRPCFWIVLSDTPVLAAADTPNAFYSVYKKTRMSYLDSFSKIKNQYTRFVMYFRETFLSM